jgi:iron complex outermembrane receptor protein
VYLPSIGGVRWDTLPLTINDIDRIEVVRGPNAASYGANSVTGVIDIITRHPAEVEGRMLSATSGGNDRRDYELRWAGGRSGMHRVGVAWHQDSGFAELHDASRAPILNYRGDIDLGHGRELSLQMGYVGGERGSGAASNPLSQPHDEQVTSHFQQLDYRASRGFGQEVLIKAYHNYLLGQETVPVDHPAIVPGTTYPRDVKAERWHAETQWNREMGDKVRLTLGGYVRSDRVNSPHFLNRTDDLVTASRGVFGHAEWRLQRRWLLNAGAMLEDHDLGGSHGSPRLALNWQPNAQHTLRIGASRAYRNPVQAEANIDWRLTLPLVGGGTTSFRELSASPSVLAESNCSREISYLGRWPGYGVSVDLRVYRDRLRQLILVAPGTRVVSNVADSRHRGMDGQVSWGPLPHTFVLLNYAQLHIDTTQPLGQYFPRHVSSLLLSHRLARDWELSMGHYRSDGFVSLDNNRPPAYRRIDLQIAREFKMEGKKARLAYILQHADGADHEYDVTANKVVSRQGFVKFQLEF